MQSPADYWYETSAERNERIAKQDADRSSCFNDHMDLVYETDLDELFAEMMRLHAIVGEERTVELLRRIFPERCAAEGF